MAGVFFYEFVRNCFVIIALMNNHTGHEFGC